MQFHLDLELWMRFLGAGVVPSTSIASASRPASLRARLRPTLERERSRARATAAPASMPTAASDACGQNRRHGETPA
jgi:hypothetical protein